jgi:hypothetical protein
VEAAPGMSVPFAFSVMFPVTTAKEGFFTVGLGAQGTQDHVEVVIPVRFAN